MKRYDHVIDAVAGTPWFIEEESREIKEIQALLSMRLRGEQLSRQEIDERLEVAAAERGPRRGGRVVGSVGVIPIYGVIMPRATLMSEFSGGATVTAIRDQFRAFLADESVGAILFDVDSPGGAVDGIEELATEIRAARGRKPMVAIANTFMASGAIYLGCQADEVIASPSSRVGSIGVYVPHVEYSRANEMEGRTVNVIRFPPKKIEANSDEPLTASARADLEETVRDYYDQFAAAAAKGYGVTVAAIRAGYGQGRVLTAKRALDAGLVHRVDTYEGAIQRLATGKVTPRIASAAADDLSGYVVTFDDGAASVSAGNADPDAAAEAEAALELGRQTREAAAEDDGDPVVTDDELALLRAKNRSRAR